MASTLPPPTSAEGRVARPDRSPRRPNYRLRRLVVLGAVVVVIGGAIGAFVLTRRGGDGGDAAPDVPSWNGVAAFDDRTDELTVFDDAGEEDDPIDVGVTGSVQLFAEGDHVVVAGDGSLAVVDIGAGDARVVKVPAESQGVRVPGTRALLVATAPSAGGDAVVASPDGDLDVASLAGLDDPLLFAAAARADADGRHVLMADSRTFQTIVAPTTGGDPQYFPGVGLGFSGDDVVVMQRAGDRADLQLTPLADGEERRVEATAPEAYLLAADGGIVLVAKDGTVSTLAPDAEELSSAATIDLGASDAIGGWVPFPAIDRLVVATDAGLSVLDGDGEVVAVVEVGLVDAATSGDPAQRCLAVVTDDGVTTLDLLTAEVTGDTVAGATAIGASSADGCTFAVPGQGGRGDTVVRDGTELAPLDGDTTIAAVAPDGTHAVVIDAAGDATLRSLDEPDDDGVALGAGASRTFVFVDR